MQEIFTDDGDQIFSDNLLRNNNCYLNQNIEQSVE